jgi:hypothetical protein
MIYYGRSPGEGHIWLITRALADEGVEVQHMGHSGKLIRTAADGFSSTADQPPLF